MNGKIFISYCWAEPSGSIVNNWLVPAIKAAGINCLVDREACGYNANIDKYEADIPNSAKVVLVVSLDFFRSTDCMFEAALAVSKCDVEKQVYVINLHNYDFRKDSDGLRESTYNYFVSKRKKSTDAMSNSSELKESYEDEIHKYDTVIQCFPTFWRVLRSKNSGELKTVSKDNFHIVCEELKQSLEDEVLKSDYIFNAELEPKLQAPRDSTTF